MASSPSFLNANSSVQPNHQIPAGLGKSGFPVSILKYLSLNLKWDEKQGHISTGCGSGICPPP